MAGTFDCRTYWPNPMPAHEIVNTFDSGIVQTYTPSTNGDGTMLIETIKGQWTDTWLIRRDPARGVLEYSDWYPGKKWYQPAIVKQPCAPGKEIIWGNIQKVGDTIESQCVTSGILGQYGWQRVKFNAILPSFASPGGTFDNVLVLEYWQSWNNGDVKGAQMWFAPGLGQIKANWTIKGKPTGFGMTLQHTTKWVPVS